ncbi:hypothetical protein TNCV_4860761 [Trichonephila clavipes]|nr:hypothetical protein TNCV_4860761 [Trichonephila clavipes]
MDGENSDPNVRVQFDTQAAAVLKESQSKPIETGQWFPTLKLLCIQEKNEKIRVVDTVDIKPVERAELAETASLDKYIWKVRKLL